MAPTLTLIAALLLGFLFWRRHDRKLIALYMARQARYRDWLDRYGKENRTQIKEYLRCFGSAFFVSPEIMHKLGPDDGVLEYYSEDYRHNAPDFLETVHFARSLYEQFGYELTEEDGNLTMGQLFERATGTHALDGSPLPDAPRQQP